jgi:hypothetical protein
VSDSVDRWPSVPSQLMYHPPLTLIDCPVMYPFRASITATSAASSTVPNRPTGIRSGLAFGLLVTISVSTNAGAMALTVIPPLIPSLASRWA